MRGGVGTNAGACTMVGPLCWGDCTPRFSSPPVANRTRICREENDFRWVRAIEWIGGSLPDPTRAFFEFLPAAELRARKSSQAPRSARHAIATATPSWSRLGPGIAMARRKTVSSARSSPPSPADPTGRARSAVSHLPVDATGRVKLTLALSLDRGAAERLSARAIAEGRNLEDVAAELLERAAPPRKGSRE